MLLRGKLIKMERKDFENTENCIGLNSDGKNIQVRTRADSEIDLNDSLRVQSVLQDFSNRHREFTNKLQQIERSMLEKSFEHSLITDERPESQMQKLINKFESSLQEKNSNDQHFLELLSSRDQQIIELTAINTDTQEKNQELSQQVSRLKEKLAISKLNSNPSKISNLENRLADSERQREFLKDRMEQMHLERDEELQHLLQNKDSEIIKSLKSDICCLQQQLSTQEKKNTELENEIEKLKCDYSKCISSLRRSLKASEDKFKAKESEYESLKAFAEEQEEFIHHSQPIP